LIGISASLVPAIEVSSRTALAEKRADLIDLDARRIASGHATIEDLGCELFRKTWAASSTRARGRLPA
jgi:galactarate dehydratase